MDVEIEKIVGNYPDNILSSIWSESLPLLDTKKRIGWAYEENICGKAQMWLLKYKTTGEYFGCSALLPRYFFVNGKKMQGALIADTAVKKKYRALGPALNLHKEIIKSSQDFGLIMAFPNREVQAVIKMVGFKKMKNLINNIKIIKSITIIERKIKNPFIFKVLLPLVPIVDFGLMLLDFRIVSGKKFTGCHIENFDKRFDDIWEKFSRKFDFIIDRSSNYLNWRYRRNPRKNYNIYVLYERDSPNLLGYIIYYIEDNWVYVDDFLWLEESLKLENLLSLFISTMRKKDVKLICFEFIDNSLIQKSFKRMRFFKMKSTHPIFYFSSDEFLNQIFPQLIRKAFITSGDSDF